MWLITKKSLLKHSNRALNERREAWVQVSDLAQGIKDELNKSDHVSPSDADSAGVLGMFRNKSWTLWMRNFSSKKTESRWLRQELLIHLGTIGVRDLRLAEVVEVVSDLNNKLISSILVFTKVELGVITDLGGYSRGRQQQSRPFSRTPAQNKTEWGCLSANCPCPSCPNKFKTTVSSYTDVSTENTWQ